jgi:hypothetical protein
MLREQWATFETSSTIGTGKTLAPLTLLVDKSDPFDSASCHHVRTCSSITLIITTTIVRNVASQIVPVENVTADIVRHICTDQFQSATQSHPHGPWLLNGMELGDVSERFPADLVDHSHF